MGTHYDDTEDRGFPDMPKDRGEMMELADETFRLLKQVREILWSQDMWPVDRGCEWQLCISEGDVRQWIYNMSIDVQLIKSVLVNRGLVDETTLVELEPRWRVDDYKHHKRNLVMFWCFTRSVIYGSYEWAAFDRWQKERLGRSITQEEFHSWKPELFQNESDTHNG